MPRLTFDNCVKVHTSPGDKNTLADQEFFNVEFVVNGEQKDEVVYFLSNKNALAAASPVFNKQFFGSLKRKRGSDSDPGSVEVIKVGNVAAKAFKKFLQMLFTDRDLTEEFATACSFNVLFQVLKLADMYCIDDLQASVVKIIENKEITRGNIIKAIASIEEHRVLQPFGSVCESLMNRCCRMSSLLWPTTQDFFLFCGANKHHMDLLYILLTKVTIP